MAQTQVKLSKNSMLSNQDFERAYLNKKAPKDRNGKPLKLKSKRELKDTIMLRDALLRGKHSR